MQVNSHLDQDFQKIINNAMPDFTERLITATNDVTISSTIDNVIGTYGGNVKEYSDQTVLKLDGLDLQWLVLVQVQFIMQLKELPNMDFLQQWLQIFELKT
ncbi:hypothetical protein [uncultured Methanobrevibacter sp.]|uniref:hypothetical protein n=1 Tax=uncultured Methanobrevibacter sp. TaxID=253161 RepID=UPI0025CF79CF|nr:hypothetical protein [uncultured Methanobrevibacter sp.]